MREVPSRQRILYHYKLRSVFYSDREISIATFPCHDRHLKAFYRNRDFSIAIESASPRVATEFHVSQKGLGRQRSAPQSASGAPQRALCVRSCARDRPTTVHCLGHCSWTLFTNTVHEHCSKKKKKRPSEIGASQFGIRV